MGHIHFYDYYDADSLFRGLVGCLQASDTPKLEIGDTVDYQGTRYEALPTLVGSTLDVARDRAGAQVAILGRKEPALNEKRELAGATAGSAGSD